MPEAFIRIRDWTAKYTGNRMAAISLAILLVMRIFHICVAYAVHGGRFTVNCDVTFVTQSHIHCNLQQPNAPSSVVARA
ncbi:hypothetical protein EV421DRAFT_1761882 [Armillaria borealis]|uniref:Uncharacterized protein n=1 Tax=Armillaria borealis TaxID=47425 RepID=A0AA39K453_9AGAR|nr:hypothetical protein EV421DRAFT_1761882 [Armillaria borealis]